MLMIAPNMVVTVHYTLRDGGHDGEVVESTLQGEPLAFIYGVGMMIEDFEKNLAGKLAGDAFAFGIPSDRAYGEYDEDARAEIPRSVFNLEPDQEEQLFQLGNMLPLVDGEGHQLDGLVVGTTETTITVDFNHPMAGVDLHFTGEVVSVRPAEPEELAHGHVHGPGGHHH
jgi:FKBP-type peptidyl-prolyl cis-trans isomerase SlyD